MCGRYSLATTVEELAELFSLAGVPPLQPRYNIAASQRVAVIRLSPGDGWRRLDLGDGQSRTLLTLVHCSQRSRMICLLRSTTGCR